MLVPSIHFRTDHLIEASRVNKCARIGIVAHQSYASSAHYHINTTPWLLQRPRPADGRYILLTYINCNATTSIQFVRSPESSVGHDIMSQSGASNVVSRKGVALAVVDLELF
jgi:hypothetical protein